MISVVRIRTKHLPLVKDLVLQTNEYFGVVPPDPLRTYSYIERLITSEAQLFWGYLDDSRLGCLLGQRFAFRVPAWIENFVYLNKDITRSYNLRSTGFLDCLDTAIKHGEENNRCTFLTAFPTHQVQPRLRATSRALRHYPNHTLRQYIPSVWYAGHGDFEDARVLIGLSSDHNRNPATILQWTRPMSVRGSIWPGLVPFPTT